MSDRPRMQLISAVLGTPDPRASATFYENLLGWPRKSNDDDWVTLRPGDGPGLSFQLEETHEPPTWPQRPGAQQMQVHLDFQVDDLEAATAYAVEVGAVLAEHQPQDDVRVLLDPDGHPFCLFV